MPPGSDWIPGSRPKLARWLLGQASWIGVAVPDAPGCVFLPRRVEQLNVQAGRRPNHHSLHRRINALRPAVLRHQSGLILDWNALERIARGRPPYLASSPPPVLERPGWRAVEDPWPPAEDPGPVTGEDLAPVVSDRALLEDAQRTATKAVEMARGAVLIAEQALAVVFGEEDPQAPHGEAQLATVVPFPAGGRDCLPAPGEVAQARHPTAPGPRRTTRRGSQPTSR